MKNNQNYYEDEGLSVKQWCDKLVSEGHELTLNWEGGGDSGWAYFEIDGEEADNIYTRALIDACYDELDYGSWAGEFSASGSALYSTEDGAFIGTDNYTEEDYVSHECNIEVKIPKTIWFDNISFNLEEDNARVFFNITNGFLTDNHQLLEKQLGSQLFERIDEEITKFNQNHNFSRYSEEFSVERSEFVETEDGHLVYTIKALEIAEEQEDEKDIYLEVGESVENYFKSQSNQENES